MTARFREWRFLALLLAALCAAIACFLPATEVETRTYNWFVMVDITRSMNARDYAARDRAVSRLEQVRQSLQHALKTLPCGSRMGLGVFAERSTAPLFFPVEVCANYALIATAIARLDWRMAWVADSNIARALESALDLMADPDLRETYLAFITDGHEAPPVNPDYEPDFSQYRVDGVVPGMVRMAAEQRAAREAAVEFGAIPDRPPGLLIGAGGDVPVQIPKFDEDGNQIGYYVAADVPHAARFGLPKDPSKIPGYIPRNAEWGPTAPVGTEHLSSLKEDYLLELAKKTNLRYARMDADSALAEALADPRFAMIDTVRKRRATLPALLALFLIVIVYLSNTRGARNLSVTKIKTA